MATWDYNYSKYNEYYRRQALKELESVLLPIRQAQLKKITEKKLRELFNSTALQRSVEIQRLFSIPELSNISFINKNFPADSDNLKLVVNNNRLERGLERAVLSGDDLTLLNESIDNSISSFQTTLIAVNNRRIINLLNKLENVYPKVKDIEKVLSDISASMDIEKDFELLANKKTQNIQATEKAIGEIQEDNYWLYDGPTTGAGTKTGKIRDFCKTRAGKVFLKEDIDSWNSLHWEGKIPGSSVWDTVGGYNCRHWIVAFVDDEEDLRTTAEHTDEEYERYSKFIGAIGIETDET